MLNLSNYIKTSQKTCNINIINRDWIILVNLNGEIMLFAHDNKRSFQRMELELPIEITKDGIAVKGVCKDLSSTGMFIMFNDSNLVAGDEVHIKLETADDRFSALNADATLLRVDEQKVGFTAAVNFINLM
jgi:hypothetical protein